MNNREEFRVIPTDPAQARAALVLQAVINSQEIMLLQITADLDALGVDIARALGL